MTLIKKIKTQADLTTCQAILPHQTMDDVEEHIYRFYCDAENQLRCGLARTQVAELGALSRLRGRTKYEGCYWVSNALLSGDCACTAELSIVWETATYNVTFTATLAFVRQECSERLFSELFNQKDEIDAEDFQAFFRQRLETLQAQVREIVEAQAKGTPQPSMKDCVTAALTEALAAVYPEFTCALRGVPTFEEILSEAALQQFEDDKKRAADARELELLREKLDHELAKDALDQKKKEALHDFYMREINREIEKKQKEVELRVELETEEVKIRKMKEQMELEIRQAKEQVMLDCQKLESERNLVKLQEEMAHAQSMQEKTRLRIETEKAEAELQEALAKSRANQKEQQAREELIQYAAELEKAKLQSKIAQEEADRQALALRIKSLEGLLASPETLTLVDMVGLPEETLGEARYLPALVVAKIKSQFKKSPIRMRKNAVVESTSRSPMLGKKPKALRINDSLSFDITCDREGYLTTLCFGTGGDISVLVPNCFDPVAKVTPGKHAIPSETDKLLPQADLDELGIGFYECGPKGFEQFISVITPTPMIDADLIPDPDEPSFVELDEDDFRAFMDKLYALPKDSWSAGYVSFYVEE